MNVETPPTPNHAPSGHTESNVLLPVPYIVWDVVLVVAAAAVLLGFVTSQDVPGDFWKSYGLQTAIGLLGAVALYLSVRFGVPNLAVAGIAIFASVLSGKAAGPEGSSMVVIGLAVVIGLVIGVVLAGLVVGLRIPAWGATLGVTGLLAALSLKSVDGQTVQVATGNSIIDWGIALLVVAVALSVGVAVAGLVLGSRSGHDDVGTPEKRPLARDPQTLVLQAVALIVSSAIAAFVGALLALRANAVNGQTGLDLARPLSILLLSAVSLRGRGSGIVGLVAAAVVIETAAIWTMFRGNEFVDQLVIAGGLALLGLVVGGVLELVSARRPVQSSPSHMMLPPLPPSPPLTPPVDPAP